MAKLINLIHPYEVDTIKTINDFFIILKSIIRLSSKKIIEKKDGILIPVRWSSKKNNWVVDRGTDLFRDIEGIDGDNIDFYFKKEEVIYKAILFTLKTINNKNVEDTLENFNLKKNENKFFAFEYCNNTTNIIENDTECIYPIGLFQRCQTKKRSGIYSKKHKSIIIDNSNQLLENITNCNNKIFNLNSYRIENYINNFSKFYNEVVNKIFEFNLLDKNISFKIKDFLNEDINKNVSQKEVLSFLSNNNNVDSFKFNKIKINTILYLVYFDFVKFIKNILNIENNNLEGFVVIDTQNNIYYKITGDFVLKVFKKNNTFSKKELLSPLLPGVF